jgi:hypothetical protein
MRTKKPLLIKMSSVLYYSNFCEHSKKLLQRISKMEIKSEMHFICIDKRVHDGGKIHIVLENGQKIIMPEMINKVPALLLLENYSVLYGESINDFLKPRQDLAIRKATNNNIEPGAFSFSGGGGGFGIASDSYSFLDMDHSSLSATGNGGVRQMHNYIGYGDTFNITTPVDEYDYKATKIPEDLTIEQLQQQRASEMTNISYNTKTK